MKLIIVNLLLIGVLFGFCQVIVTQPINEISCEKIEEFEWTFGSKMTCILLEGEIDSAGFFLSSSDETVEAIDYDSNKLIRYLPENSAEQFPNLMTIYAPRCSIEVISKSNFCGLHKLENLYLQENLIQKIASDTFEDLIMMDTLYLSNNA